MKNMLQPGEIATRGETIYREKLRPVLEPEQNGKVAVINVDTGEYELDADHFTAMKRAWARWPDGLFFGVRVGYPAVGHIGARFRPKTE